MAISIQNVYISTFERNLRHLAQQGDSRLRSHVWEVSTNGKEHNWERLGPGQASEKTSARTPTPTSDLPWSRRVSQTKTYHIGESTEQEDIVQMLVDPNSNITKTLAMAMKRQWDDVIIEAATADALDGDGNPVPYLASQTVGDGTGVISIDVILETQEIFYQNDVDPDEPKCFVIGPTQQRKLMQLLEVTSADFQQKKALATGMLPNFMGFDWIVSTRLLSPDTDQIDCLAFTRRAIGVQVNRDITARVQEDPSLSFAWRLYAFMTMGAVRVEDEHMVRVTLRDAIV